MTKKPLICSICKKPIEKIGNWTEGNNAQPINDGRCCDVCDATVVIPQRLEDLILSRTRKKEVNNA